MKTLEEFDLIKEFVVSTGITPTMAMVCSSGPEWQDLVYLAREWKNRKEEETRAWEEEVAGMSEEELAQRTRDAAEEAQREEDAVLYHSCGHRPGR